MDSQYHRQLCQKAFANIFSKQAIEVIINANIRQDWGINFFNAACHFYHQQMAASQDYIRAQRKLILQNLNRGKPKPAQQAFGRILHAVHDFYSHTNYVHLWAKHFSKSELPHVAQFDGLNKKLLNSTKLIPCKYYAIRDNLYFVPFLREWILRNIPENSHARMHLDNPDAGQLFDYALEGALQRTIWELNQILKKLGKKEKELFFGYS